MSTGSGVIRCYLDAVNGRAGLVPGLVRGTLKSNGAHNSTHNHRITQAYCNGVTPVTGCGSPCLKLLEIAAVF